jgi:hypothetical protein
VASLQQELAVEVGLKLQAEAVVADLTVKVASRRAEIVRKNIEERKLRNQMDGKILLAFTILSEFSGMPLMLLMRVWTALDEKLG